MKTLTKTTPCGRKLALTGSLIMLVGTISGLAANYLIVNESYDPPPSSAPGGWQDGNVANVTRQFVNQGVGHSTALQFSGTLLGPDYCDIATQVFQTGVMGGNELATLGNTVLSFDLKVDQPGLLNLDVYIDGFAEYVWNNGDTADAHYMALVGTISLAYQPGVFQRIVLPLNDPRLGQDSYSMAPIFNPSARTYNNIALRVTSGSFAALQGSFTITVDNLQLSTKNPMVAFNGNTAGAFKAQPDGSGLSTGTGLATHVGSFTQVITLPADSTPPSFELTAANGDKLLGAFYFGGNNDLGFQILNGTGRFEGAVGSYRALVTFGPQPDPNTFPYTATFMGGISTVGSNR